MKIQILSDIHIEFGPFEIQKTEADVVICAGDIGVGQVGLSWLKDTFEKIPILYILGNHEYYGKAYPKLHRQLSAVSAGSNIHVLENDDLEIDGVRFLGCTLWTDFDLQGNRSAGEFSAMQVMNDFKRIRRSPSYSKLRAVDTVAIHKDSLKWMEQTLENKNNPGKMIVITHHAPSSRSIPNMYRNNTLSAAFASNLEHVIEQSQATIWVHGHVHNSCDYKIGSTRVICNPRGYPHELNPNFVPNLVIEI